ncbi:hypothetical protein, partial [Streptomyces sp. e14]|uniref:hypothetical protein n=1 Tax=Streptomyces sp. e14 TaxID=645465 RepID=UPI0005B9439A
MRTLVALPAFYAVSRAPQLLAALVALGLALGTRAAGASPLGMVAVALLGLLARPARLHPAGPAHEQRRSPCRAGRVLQAADAVPTGPLTYVPSP